MRTGPSTFLPRDASAATKLSRAAAAEAELNRPPEEVAYVPSRAEQRTALLFAGASVATAFLAAAPAAYEIYDASQSADWTEASPWAWILLALAGLELGYAAYLALAPDFSALRTAACFYVAAATALAAFLGFFQWAALTHPGLAALELAEPTLRTKAKLWCLMLICVHGGMAYFLGKASVAWLRRHGVDDAE